MILQMVPHGEPVHVVFPKEHLFHISILPARIDQGKWEHFSMRNRILFSLWAMALLFF
jgi:hypothetical protein